jgi:hypothetical protein
MRYICIEANMRGHPRGHCGSKCYIRSELGPELRSFQHILIGLIPPPSLGTPFTLPRIIVIWNYSCRPHPSPTPPPRSAFQNTRAVLVFGHVEVGGGGKGVCSRTIFMRVHILSFFKAIAEAWHRLLLSTVIQTYWL